MYEFRVNGSQMLMMQIHRCYPGGTYVLPWHLQAHGGRLEEDSEASDDSDDSHGEDEDDDEEDEYADERTRAHQGVVIEELEDGVAPAAVRTPRELLHSH